MANQQNHQGSFISRILTRAVLSFALCYGVAWGCDQYLLASLPYSIHLKIVGVRDTAYNYLVSTLTVNEAKIWK